MVRVARLELAASWSQTRRPTNWATPGYEIKRNCSLWSNMWSRKFHHRFTQLSTGVIVGKLRKNREVNNISGSRTVCAFLLPKQARYQLRYTRSFTLRWYIYVAAGFPAFFLLYWNSLQNAMPKLSQSLFFLALKKSERRH